MTPGVFLNAGRLLSWLKFRSPALKKMPGVSSWIFFRMVHPFRWMDRAATRGLSRDIGSFVEHALP
jgi:hypothetical protein